MISIWKWKPVLNIDVFAGKFISPVKFIKQNDKYLYQLV
jgi:hypothetical protein